MKMKSFLALLLTLLMLVTMVTACSTDEEPAPGNSDAGNVDPDGGDDSDDAGEITEIDFWWTAYSGAGNDKVDMVEEAVNALTEEEIGVHVNFTRIAQADYPTQLGLGIANQEGVDVAVYQPGYAGSFLTYYANGSLLDITDLLDEHGKEVKELFGEDLLKMTTVDGRIYGLSTYRLLNSNLYLCIRKDTLEAAGVLEAAETMTSWPEWEAVMQAIVDSGTTTVPFGCTGTYGLFADAGAILIADGAFDDTILYDTLGDSLGVVFSDQSGNLSILQEQPEFVAQCKMTHRWYDKGYIWPESAYSSESSETLIGQGVKASYIVFSEYGVEVNKSQTCGTDMLCREIGNQYLSTTQGQKFGIFIPSSSDEPVAAMKFINLLYTNADLMNLMIHGVENETYVLENGEATYPAGTDMSTCGYHYMDFTLGNQFLTWPWKGSGADFRTGAMENFLAAEKSAYIGFTLDTSEYATLVSNISAVMDEYIRQMTIGNYSDELYNEFMEKLESAGVDEWISIYQNALDAWLAA